MNKIIYWLGAIGIGFKDNMGVASFRCCFNKGCVANND